MQIPHTRVRRAQLCCVRAPGERPRSCGARWWGAAAASLLPCHERATAPQGPHLLLDGAPARRLGRTLPPRLNRRLRHLLLLLLLLRRCLLPSAGVAAARALLPKAKPWHWARRCRVGAAGPPGRRRARRRHRPQQLLLLPRLRPRAKRKPRRRRRRRLAALPRALRLLRLRCRCRWRGGAAPGQGRRGERARRRRGVARAAGPAGGLGRRGGRRDDRQAAHAERGREVVA